MIIESWGLPIAITILAVGVRCMVDEQHASIHGVIRAILLGLFVGSVANLYLLDYVTDSGEILSGTKRAAYVGIASGFGQELYLWFKKTLSNPQDIFNRLR